MTTLKKKKKKRHVSLYAVLQAMKINPVNNWGYYNKKVSGKDAVDVELLRNICRVVSEISGKQLTLEDLKYDTKSVKVL